MIQRHQMGTELTGGTGTDWTRSMTSWKKERFGVSQPWVPILYSKFTNCANLAKSLRSSEPHFPCVTNEDNSSIFEQNYPED